MRYLGEINEPTSNEIKPYRGRNDKNWFLGFISCIKYCFIINRKIKTLLWKEKKKNRPKWFYANISKKPGWRNHIKRYNKNPLLYWMKIDRLMWKKTNDCSTSSTITSDWESHGLFFPLVVEIEHLHFNFDYILVKVIYGLESPSSNYDSTFANVKR